MSYPIGANILLSHVKDYGKLNTRLQAIKPAFVVATVDGDNDMKLIHGLRAALPGVLVFGRVYMSNDGAFHQKPDNGNQWLAAPDDCLNRWGELGKNGGVLYLLNEPGTHVSDAQVARLVEWSCEVLDKAHARQIRVCIDNFGVEHPPVMNGEWDSRFDPLLRTLAKYPEMILGLHEYLPLKGLDRVGRFKALVKRCQTLGVAVPKIAITEAGYDTIDGSVENGYKSRGIPGDRYAMTLHDIWQREYASTPQIMGLAVYCYGDNGDWKAFDTEGDEGYWQTLTSLSKQPPIVVTPPPPVADYLPPRTYQPAVAHLKNGAGMVNLRSEKSTAPGTDIGDIRAGDKVKYAPLEGDWWPLIHILPNGKETAGFAHNDYFEPVPRQSESPPPENPTPLPIPDPPQQVLVTPHVHIVVTLPAGIDPQLEAAMKNNVTIEFRKTA